jgi:YD repeat-containing protein
MGFSDKPVYDENGFEKPCRFEKKDIVTVTCGPLWNKLTAREKKETVAIELGGLIPVKNRYSFGSKVFSLTSDDGSWIVSGASSRVGPDCHDSDCELEAQLNYYFQYADPAPINTWDPGTYKLQSQGQAAIRPYAGSLDTYTLYINTEALSPVTLLAHIRTDLLSDRVLAHLLDNTYTALRRIDFAYDAAGSLTSTTSVDASSTTYEFKTLHIASGKVALILKGTDQDGKTHWYTFTYKS